MAAILKTLLGAIVGLLIGVSLCWLADESPLHILSILLKSGFGTPYDFGMSLVYTAPLILTGLAVAIPLRSGLFNIGAEGQLNLGAIAAAGSALLAQQWGWSGFAGTFFAIACAFLAGAFWGWIPGVLKAKRGSHEVITTIMLNFIAAGVSAYLALYWFKDQESTEPRTQMISESMRIAPWKWFEGAPIGWFLVLFIALAVAIHLAFRFTAWGYRLKAVGENEVAASRYGISRGSVWQSSLFLSGGIAGLVGVSEVLGNSHCFRMGFSADYGFVGIAVALVARGNLLAVIPSAFLFGVLQKGSASLDLETEQVTRDLSYVIQGLIILGVAAEGLWTTTRSRRKKLV